MTRELQLLAVAITLAMAPATSWCAAKSGDKGTRSYRWVDKNGVTHYGDYVPPEYAGQGRSELNSQGVPVREIPRQLTAEEGTAAQKAAAETARRRQHDSFLLQTYTKVSDIEQLRDERLALIDGQTEIARGSLAANVERLKKLEERASSYAPYSKLPAARPMPEQLAQEIVRSLSERRMLRTALASREKERADVRAGFDNDIVRYKELTRLPGDR
jgi:hypothetical protein